MWIPVAIDHISPIHQAFQTQAQSRRHDNAGYLAHPGISEFHAQRLIKRIQTDPSHVYISMSNGRVCGILGIERSDWHSDHFGVSYFKANPFYCFTTNPEEIEGLVESAIRLFDKEQSLYTLRTDAHQTALSYQLSRYRFRHVGTSIRMGMDSNQKKTIDSRPKPSYDTYQIREYRMTDIPSLQEIIKRSHTHSHFYCEVRFSPERVRELFAEWIRRWGELSRKRENYTIWVAESNGQMLGFCSVMVQSGLKDYINRQIGVIDFIVTDVQNQGTGIGQGLLNQAIAWMGPETDIVELRTMADNVAAVRFYEKHGFRMLSADQHFHWWT